MCSIRHHSIPLLFVLMTVHDFESFAMLALLRFENGFSQKMHWITLSNVLPCDLVKYSGAATNTSSCLSFSWVSASVLAVRCFGSQITALMQSVPTSAFTDMCCNTSSTKCANVCISQICVAIHLAQSLFPTALQHYLAFSQWQNSTR